MPRKLTRLLVVLAVAVGTLAWTAPTAGAAPANDDFADAVALAGPAGTVSGTTIGATSEPGEPCQIEVWGCGASVWYTWQTESTTTTQVSFDTCVDAYDTTLQVFTGNSLETLEIVAEDDGACGLGSRVFFAAVPGTTYSIRVGGYGTSAGPFQLEYCEGAVCLTVSTSGTGTGTITGPGIDCPGDCAESYEQGADVTLTATPTGDSIFGGWSGDCSGAGTCELTMGVDRAVSASFYPPLFCRGQAVTIYGTDGDDTIDGTSGADVIAGLGGDDTITGGDDDDLICSAGGEDTVAGGAGADVVRGGGDDDLLAGNAANDILRGLDGDDSMFGGPGADDTCDGGAGTADTAGANCEQTLGVP